MKLPVADGQHQHKEEQALFPQLLRVTTASQEDLLRKLQDDHAREWRCMQDMRSNFPGAMSGEPLCVREFAKVAKAYVQLHREHIAHEDTVLFPLAEQLLSPADDAEVRSGFERVDAGGSDMAGVFEQIRSLCKRLGVSVEAQETA